MLAITLILAFGFGILSIYLINLVIKERDYQLDILIDLEREQEKIEAIEMANESFKKEFGDLKERYILLKSQKTELDYLLRTQNDYFRGVLYDKKNDTIVLADNLERIGDL